MHRNMRFSKRLAVVLTVTTLALAACGDDDEESSSTSAAAGATETVAPVATEPASDRAGYGDAPAATDGAAPAADAAGLLLADTGLGQVVTAANGMTVYMFMPDNMGAPTCTADCAQAWPPLLVDEGAEATAGEGLDAALLATATHPEGGIQVTYGGWPLYYFAGDSAPGDTNGQGQGDVWYAIDAAGAPIP